MTGTDAEEARRDALVERLFGAAVRKFDLCGVYIGDRLGLYRALAERGPVSATELASAAGIKERYALEWLEQQAASAILDLVDSDDGVQRFALPPGHAEALLDEEESELCRPIRTPIGRLSTTDRCAARRVQAWWWRPLRGLWRRHARRPGGVHPTSLRTTAGSEVAAVRARDPHARLQADPPARVAEHPLWSGISSMSIARGYPKVRVDGIDLDEASIDAARRHLAGSGVEERVRFTLRDAADPALAHQYDLVTVFEALHDMSYPVEVLRAARALLADGGVVLVGDERTAQSFRAPADDLERLYYGFSILHCLPVGMVGERAARTGTVIRPATVESYARDAGFSNIEEAPMEHGLLALLPHAPITHRRNRSPTCERFGSTPTG